MTTMWTRQAIDAEIDRRAQERSGVSAGLLELDDHPGRRLLDGAKLSGVTAQAWDKAAQELAGLWTVFEAYQKVLDRVAAMRGGPKTKLGDRELAALAELLTGRSVALPRQAVPFERRGLLDPASTQDLLTLNEAVESMTRTYDTVKRVAVDAESAWNRLLEPLDELQAKVRTARGTADQVGVGADPVFGRLAAIEAQSSDMRRRALSDPLGMVAGGESDSTAGAWAGTWAGAVAGAAPSGTPARVTRLLAELAGVQAELDQALAARTEFDQRLAGVEEVIVLIARAEAEAERVRGEVREKIAAPKLPPASAAAAHLRTKVAELQRERTGQSWTLLGRNLSALEKNSRVVLENAQKRVGQVRAPLDRRDELRGLLEAYRARAARHGVSEVPALAAAHGLARELLWSAPCDLAGAEAAVRHYQAAVGAALPSLS